MISVVVPCCNEEGNVRRFEAELFPFLPKPHEVIAVDDGSKDGTAAELAKLPVKLVSHPVNRGLGAALLSGFAEATGEWIVTLDADLTFHPRHIARLIDKQKDTCADLVAGSPFETAESDVPWMRKLPSLMLNAFYRGLFSHKLTSYTPIFRLYRRSALKGLGLVSDGFEINAEIAARFVQRKLKVAEVAVPLTTRTSGESKLDRWRELRRHARLILRLMSGR